MIGAEPGGRVVDLSSLSRVRTSERRPAGDRRGARRPAAEPRAGRARRAGLDPAVTRVLAGLGLIAAYLALCLAPLALVSLGPAPPRRPFAIELSVALGYVGLSMLVLQFALVSRIEWLARPFGIDILHRFHRKVSFVAMAFVLAHPLLLLAYRAPSYLPLLDLRSAPWRARFAVASVAALLLVVVVSLLRGRLRLPYEAWKASHGVLSAAVVVLALAHMVGVDRFTGRAGGRAVVVLVAVGAAGAIVWSRLIAPRRRGFLPWRVVDVIPERGRAVTLVAEPEHHPGWSFLPGQFAWLRVASSPFGVTDHPFSLSSPADPDASGRIAMTIKQQGDWTRRAGAIQPGTRLYLDGPHGSFSTELSRAPGYVFVAGGVGITPIYSMLTTMFLREDTRPALLFYASADWDGITFRDQLDELTTYMPNLRVVYVLGHPPPGWDGETGRVAAPVLLRHLPRQYRTFDCFLCASEAMMDAAEAALVEIGVAGYRIHSERFAMP